MTAPQTITIIEYVISNVDDAPSFAGRPSFTAHDITTTADRPRSVDIQHSTTMDGDGDLDVYQRHPYVNNDDTIAW